MSYMSVQMARHHGAMNAAEVEDRAVTTRPSSTANFAVDSLDRVQYNGTGTSANFTINKPNSLFNGFFTRISLSEITLDWCIPNVSQVTGNRSFTVLVGATTTLVTIPAGSYSIADALDAIVVALNASIGAGTFRLEDQYGAVWVAGTSYGPVYLATTAGGNFTILTGSLAEQLSLQIGTLGNAFPVTCPKLLPYYYIDFVSPELTYNQDLKDNSTSYTVRDTIYRWVFAYDNVPPPLDRYGYPILQGYKPFTTRRYLSYPKQIAWNNSMPMGQLTFQVYTSDGDLLNPTALEGEMEYQMAMLVSEN